MDRDYNKNRNQEGEERRVYKPEGERREYRERREWNGNSDRERGTRPAGERRERKSYGESGGNRYQREDREQGNRSFGNKRWENRDQEGRNGGERREYNRGEHNTRSYRTGGSSNERSGYQGGRGERRPFRTDDTRRDNRDYNRPERSDNRERPERGYNREKWGDRNRPEQERGRYDRGNSDEKREYKRKFERSDRNNEISHSEKEELRQKHYSKKKILAHRIKNENEETELRLNRFISMSGVCSRRDADELIKAGRVKVNGEVVETVGVKVKKKDRVEVDGAVIVPERKVYLVLNKPKDYVTTVDDPLERKTVMTLVEGACKERVYPIGRLDRQTTGVLLFTNDGDLAKKLTHPKFDHKKIYHVFLDKAVSEQDIQAIADGIQLEDGFIQADEISYASDDRTEVGIEIHSGKNRIVRRIFEHFGYQIVKLDRVYFAGITKKNIPRGKWRFLTSEEVNILKYY